jgi:hypothetical protein
MFFVGSTDSRLSASSCIVAEPSTNWGIIKEKRKKREKEKENIEEERMLIEGEKWKIIAVLC